METLPIEDRREEPKEVRGEPVEQLGVIIFADDPNRTI